MALKTVEVSVKSLPEAMQKAALRRGYSMDGTVPVEYEDTSPYPCVIGEDGKMVMPGAEGN